jgi:hypothetical protein
MLGVKVEVIEAIERPYQAPLLHDHAETERASFGGARKGKLLPGDPDLSRRRSHGSERNLHEGGFACAIVPDDGMNAAAAYLEVDVLKHPDLTEALANALHLKNTFGRMRRNHRCPLTC